MYEGHYGIREFLYDAKIPPSPTVGPGLGYVAPKSPSLYQYRNCANLTELPTVTVVLVLFVL